MASDRKLPRVYMTSRPGLSPTTVLAEEYRTKGGDVVAFLKILNADAKRDTRRQIVLPREMNRRLEEEAKNRGISVNEFVNQALAIALMNCAAYRGTLDL